MLNQCIFEGRLVADPELKRTPSGMSICNFKIAVDKTIKKEGKPSTLFMPVTFFGSVADNCAKFLRKGRPVIVIGRLDVDEFQDKGGERKSVIFLNGSNFEFPLTEGKKPESPSETAETGGKPTYKGAGLSDLDVVDDDMPF